MQVASRIWCLWGIVNAVPAATVGGGIPAKPLAMLGPLPIQLNLISLLTAWCLSEVRGGGLGAPMCPQLRAA